MSSTPPASAEEKTRYGRQIEEAFEAAAKLAGSNLAPSEFYEQFLNRTLSAIDAPAGAVWLRTPQGFLQVACQLNLDKIGLDSKRAFKAFTAPYLIDRENQIPDRGRPGQEKKGWHYRARSESLDDHHV